jgi:photosystem II stability/assembly factor-like uncharacterized protein
MRLIAFLCAVLLTQEPPPPKPAALENTGKPMRMEAVCRQEEITENGLECPEDEPCPVFLDLTSLETAGVKIFLSGNFHTASATLWSVLLASEDEGKTWAEPWPRQRSATLDMLQVIDFEVGWAAGHTTGTLLRDPFLLKTSDGGKSWKRLPVFDDARVGVIDNFWFESREKGLLVIDRLQAGRSGRFQRLETMTGGDSWMVREVSTKPIPTKRPKGNTGNADWRLRVEAASKTHRIEHRVEGRWTLVASFAVAAGACKP